jgi:hypothetical protein
MLRRSKSLSISLVGLPVILLISIAAAVAQTPPPGVEGVQIPPGVKYKYADATSNQAAQSHILNAFKSGKDPSVLGNRLIVGPNLWKRIRNVPEVSSIPKGVVNFKIPFNDERGKLVRVDEREGKLIQSNADRSALYSALSAFTLGKDLHLRKLRPDELSYYWSIISYDIEEPLFALEAPELTMLVQYVSKTKNVFFIDELAGSGKTQAAHSAPADQTAKDMKKRQLQESQRKAALNREQEAKRQKARQESACTYKPVMSNDDLRNCGLSSH